MSYPSLLAPLTLLVVSQTSQRDVTEYLSPEEIQALNTLRVEMQKYGLNLSDEKLVQALMARKFEVDRAVLLVRNQLEWKQGLYNTTSLSTAQVTPYPQ